MENTEKQIAKIKNEIIDLQAQLKEVDEYVVEELKKYEKYMLEYNGISALQTDLYKIKTNLEKLLENEEQNKQTIEEKKKEFKIKFNKFKNLKNEYDKDIVDYETYLRELKGENEIKTKLQKKKIEIEQLEKQDNQKVAFNM